MTHRKRAFTLIEILIGLSFLSMFSYFSYTLVTMTARRSISGDKKLQSTRAALDIAGRLRRDLKWATSARIDSRGHRMVLTGPDGGERLWEYDPTSRELRLPSITDPTVLVHYRLASFRTVWFQQVPGTPRVKYVISAMAIEAGTRPSPADIEHSMTIVGEVRLRNLHEAFHHPYWSE